MAFDNLRRHQREVKALAEDIVSGAHQIGARKHLVLAVTPGGGKTAAARIAGDVLLAGGVIERIVYLAPRANLVRQVMISFAEGGVPLLHGEAGKLRQRNFVTSRGTCSTYQMVGEDVEGFTRHVAEKRTMLVLDEAQFLAIKHVDNLGDWSTLKEEAAWYQSVKPLYDAAAVVLIMTGTINRQDGQPLAFVDYQGGLPCVDVRYTRKDALREHAVIPMEFIATDADAAWTVNGFTRQSTLREARGKDVSRTRSAFLDDTRAVDDFTRKGLDHWKTWRARNSLAAEAKCIVLTKSIDEAKRVTKWMQDEGIRAAIAVSNDGDGRSVERITDFAKGFGGHVLVTVAMAHVGLDVPDATHLICLSRYRSRPWLEQAFARVTRFNPNGGSWDAQRAFVFVPDELEMQAFIEEMEVEQEDAIRERKPHAINAVLARNSAEIENLGAALNGGVRYAVDGVGFLSDAENAGIGWLDEHHPEFIHLAPTDKLRVWRAIQSAAAPSTAAE